MYMSGVGGLMMIIMSIGYGLFSQMVKEELLGRRILRLPAKVDH